MMRRDTVDFPATLGFDGQQLDAILGDLAEERVERAALYGRAFARAWWCSEILRSTPPLIVGALRRGTPAARARLGALLAAPLVIVALVAVLHRGPPARLAIPGGTTVVINKRSPVQLTVHVLDARGHALESAGVHYRWLSGAPLVVSPTGVTSCTSEGTSVVRASIDRVAANFAVTCRPVREIRAVTDIDLIAGGVPQTLPFMALGLADNIVTDLRGSMAVADSSVAVIDGTTVQPRGVGRTMLRIVVGDETAHIQVIVHQPVASFVGRNATGDFLAHRIRLAQGDTTELELPEGAMWVKYLPDGVNDAPPTIAIDAFCQVSEPGLERRTAGEYSSYCQTYAKGGKITLGHGHRGVPIVSGWLAIERVWRPK